MHSTTGDVFKVVGGTPLHGSVRIGGAKNASYKILIASLLCKSESRLLNFSHISDVYAVRNIINYLGGEVTQAGERALFVRPENLSSHKIDPDHGEQGRFSTMFIPILVHRLGKAVVPAPGGDKIGKRPLDRHFDGLKALGIDVRYKDGLFHAEADVIKGTTYRFAKNTHTGTETMIMAAVLAEGKTVLENAAAEHEVDDLIAFLNKCGAKIVRTAPRTITIEGVDSLHGAIHKILPDHNEAVSYACAALATKGDVIIENADPNDMRAFLDVLEAMEAGYEIGDYGIRFYYDGPLQAIDITTAVAPGFKTDWQPLWSTLMTQAEGTSHLHETIMSNRFHYVDDLREMGAKIELYQPEVEDPSKTYNFYLEDDKPDAKHAIAIHGPTPLKAGSFEVQDLRHGATLITAALAAEGTSYISGAAHVDRGYENLAGRLTSMGADISRVEQSEDQNG